MFGLNVACDRNPRIFVNERLMLILRRLAMISAVTILVLIDLALCSFCVAIALRNLSYSAFFYTLD
jgi:hypothetical protein